MKRNIITPLVGFEDLKLYDSQSHIENILKEKNIKFSKEVWENKGCTPEVPWTLLKIKNFGILFFANSKLWKIYFEEGFTGKLENGIQIGMTIENAKRADETLHYDDWEEDYISDYHYWLEENLETGKIVSISIFIKEVENDDLFFAYNW